MRENKGKISTLRLNMLHYLKTQGASHLLLFIHYRMSAGEFQIFCMDVIPRSGDDGCSGSKSLDLSDYLEGGIMLGHRHNNGERGTRVYMLEHLFMRGISHLCATELSMPNSCRTARAIASSRYSREASGISGQKLPVRCPEGDYYPSMSAARPYACSQFSIDSPSTRSNSRTLRVTSVRPLTRAIEAIWRS